jgi:hypothetical protein
MRAMRRVAGAQWRAGQGYTGWLSPGMISAPRRRAKTAVASAPDRGAVSLRSGRGRSAKISSRWIRDFRLLLGCLSKTGGSGSGDSTLGFAFEVAHGQPAGARSPRTKDSHLITANAIREDLACRWYLGRPECAKAKGPTSDGSSEASSWRERCSVTSAVFQMPLTGLHASSMIEALATGGSRLAPRACEADRAAAFQSTATPSTMLPPRPSRLWPRTGRRGFSGCSRDRR